MGKRNLYSLQEALEHPRHAKDLVIFLDREKDTSLFERLGELENLTELSLLDGKWLDEIPGPVAKLKNLKKLRIRDTSITEIPEGILELRNLEQLIITGSPLITLPEEIGKLSKLQIIELYQTELKSLPDRIGDLKNLLQLEIKTAALEQLPESIGDLEKLEQLQINYTKLKFLPTNLFNLQRLKGLSLVNNQLTEVSPNLSQLSTLTYFDFSKNLLQNFELEDWSNLKKLEAVYLSDNQLEKIPLAVERAPILKRLKVDGNQIKKVPEEILKCKELYLLNLKANPLASFPEPLLDWYIEHKDGSYYSSLEVDSSLYTEGTFDLLRNGTFKKMSRGDKKAFFDIFHQEKKVISKLPMEMIYKALNTAATGMAPITLSYLTKSQDKPLKTGSRVFILGKTAVGLTELKERMQSCGLEYAKKLEDATHVLLSARANKKVKKWPADINWQWITEAHLNEYFDKVDPTFLVEAADTDSDKVSSLIMSMEDDNMAIGLSIIEGGGLPENLFTEAFIVYKMSEDAATRKKAYELLKAKASPELLKVIKNRSVLNKKGYIFDQHKRKLEQLVKDYTKDSVLDIGKLAFSVYMRNGCCLVEALCDAPTQYKKLVLNKAIENNEFSPSYRDLFDVFPMELLEFPNLKQIYMKLKHGEYIDGKYHPHKDFELPKEIAKLQQLESLMIVGNVGIPPIDELATMKNLKNLTLYVNDDFNIQEAKKKLKHLERVDLRTISS